MINDGISKMNCFRLKMRHNGQRDLANYVIILQSPKKSADIVRFGFGEAISFSPSVSFTLMHVYINTGIK